MSAYLFMHHNTITDETCSVYQGRGHTNGLECSNEIICKNCKPSGVCFEADDYFLY